MPMPITYTMWLNIDENYECSEEGHVRNKNTLRILKSWDSNGYCYTRIGGAKSKKTGIHRVIASLFLPHPTGLNLEVDHIDRNKHNNHASNLRWVSKTVNGQNKSKETRARKSNKLNEIHITQNEYGIYVVTFSNSKMKHISRHRDFDEAKKIRNSILDALSDSPL
jgi:hypothetical protein